MTPHESFRLAVAQSADIEAGQREALTRRYTDRRAREIAEERGEVPFRPNEKIITVGHVSFFVSGELEQLDPETYGKAARHSEDYFGKRRSRHPWAAAAVR